MITRLRQELSLALSFTTDAVVFGAPERMSQVLTKVKKAFDSPSPVPKLVDLDRALANFFSGQQPVSFLEARCICCGIFRPQGKSGRMIMSSRDDLNRLLVMVEGYRQKPVILQRCYYDLLINYFGFPRDEEQTSPVIQENWVALRDFLYQYQPLIQESPFVPSWARMLSEHRNLLTNQPCDRYAERILSGETTEFKKICNTLLVPTESWLHVDVVLAQVKAACRQSDRLFKLKLKMLLDFVEGRGDIKLSKSHALYCLRELLMRYARSAENPEDLQMRELAISLIGNPWVHKTAWDAMVKDEPARLMLQSWIKRYLITTFFDLLQADGVTDRRRLEFWLLYENEIEDMWFALGQTAFFSRHYNYASFRKAAAGRLLQLTNCGGHENNAFIMKIGSMYIVEFGVKGNACYMYQASDAPFDLTAYSVSGDGRGLKGGTRERNQMTHAPSHGMTWEQKFRWRIHREARVVPSRDVTPTTTQPAVPVSSISSHLYHQINYFADNHRLTVEDERPSGGSVWVLAGNSDMTINRQLTSWGFKYNPLRGWYKE